jgi:hypothetical protein
VCRFGRHEITRRHPCPPVRYFTPRSALAWYRNVIVGRLGIYSDPGRAAPRRREAVRFRYVAIIPDLCYRLVERSVGVPLDEKNSPNAWKSSATKKGGAVALDSEALIRQQSGRFPDRGDRRLGRRP